MFHIAFVEPKIPPNTGNAIRMVAATGCHLHLIGPLDFDLSEPQLRRAGLDYHDLAQVTVHADLAAAWPVLTSTSAQVTPQPTAQVTPQPTAQVTPQPTAQVTPPPTAHVTSQPTATANRIFAFTVKADHSFADIEYRPDDVLMFGPEPTGLSEAVLADPHVTARVRIPMLAGRRSLNLSNAAAVAAYEAWRQQGYSGGV